MSQEPEKKRKRKDESEKPRKKKAVESSGSYIKITHVSASDGLGLVVASGPGLAVPDAKFNAYKKEDYNDDGRGELLLRSSDHKNLNFTAREQHEGAGAQPLKHYVGIYDEKMQELKLVEARHVNLRSTMKEEDDFMLRQQMENEETGAAARRALGMEFGTKKAKKAIAQNADNRVIASEKKQGKPDSAASAVLSMLEASVAEAPTTEAMQAETNAAKPRPKHNPDAKTPQEAYTIPDVVGEDMMRILKVKPWVDAVDADEEIKVESQFVIKRIVPLVEEDQIAMLKVTKYILVLVKFLDACTVKGKAMRRIPKRDELREKMRESDDVINKLIDRFTKSGNLTQWHVDLMRTTVAALTLIVDGFETDTHNVREDLQLKAPEMNKYYAEIGAKVKAPTDSQRSKLKLSQKEASVHGIATLKIPLEFPKPRAIPSRRR